MIETVIHDSLDDAIRFARADCDRSIPAVRQGWRPKRNSTFLNAEP